MSKSKLVLGTVQLGLSYGVANTSGQPSTEEAFAILDAAFAGGVNTFDTAEAYGTAEEVLGAWIRKRGVAENVFVISKTKAEKPLAEEIDGSLARLILERLDGYLLHSPERMDSEEVMAGLRKAKEAGKTEHVGVSVYGERDALKAMELGMDYIQVPYNAFDQRLDATDFFDVAKELGVTVFARSPFLQGLLLMKPEEIPTHLAAARPLVGAFRDIAARHGLSPIEAALVFALGGRADHVVLGVETVAQLKECLVAAQAAAERKDFLDEVRNRFHTMDPVLVNPSLWNTLKK